MKKLVAQCALCLKVKELKRSHLLPKALYNRIRGEGTHTVLISTKAQTAVATSSQVTKYLLCEECEQRFSRLGENKVIPLCAAADGRFPLRESLMRLKSLDKLDGLERYDVSQLCSSLHINTLYYFAISIFWRASVTTWPSDQYTYAGALGPYEEMLRRYLLGEQSTLPPTVKLTVGVDAATPPMLWMSLPTSYKNQTQWGNIYNHNFNIPGIRFMLSISKLFEAVPPDMFSWPLVLLEDFREAPGFRAARYSAATAKPKGKLSKG